MKYYKESPSCVARALASSLTDGLSTQQALNLRQRYGLNYSHDDNVLPLHRLWWLTYRYALYGFIASCIYTFLFLPSFIYTALAALGMYGMFSLLEAWHTRHLEKKQKKLLKYSYTCIRDSKEVILSYTDLIPGDLLIVKPGMQVPADCRLIEGTLSVHQALITGEAEPCIKQPQALVHDARPQDQTSILFQDSFVIHGCGKALIVAIGRQTVRNSIKRLDHEEYNPCSTAQQGTIYTLQLLILLYCFMFITYSFHAILGYSIEQLLPVMIYSSYSAIALSPLCTFLEHALYRYCLKQGIFVKRFSTLRSLCILKERATQTDTALQQYQAPLIVAYDNTYEHLQAMASATYRSLHRIKNLWLCALATTWIVLIVFSCMHYDEYALHYYLFMMSVFVACIIYITLSPYQPELTTILKKFKVSKTIYSK